MALCVFVLIASEFMPVSLLTPIAGDLGLSEGQAGQAISILGLFAVLTSLFIARLSRGIDRRQLRSAFSLLLVASGTPLGLPLVKAFAEAHGGRLELASAPGRGTAATIVLPPSRLSTPHRLAA